MSVLLPMRDEGDADDDAEAALRERENLDDARVETLPVLREVFARAIAAGGARRRRAGGRVRRKRPPACGWTRTLPAGLFGAAIRARHLGLLRSGARACAAR